MNRKKRRGKTVSDKEFANIRSVNRGDTNVFAGFCQCGELKSPGEGDRIIDVDALCITSSEPVHSQVVKFRGRGFGLSQQQAEQYGLPWFLARLARHSRRQRLKTRREKLGLTTIEVQQHAMRACQILSGSSLLEDAVVVYDFARPTPEYWGTGHLSRERA